MDCLTLKNHLLPHAYDVTLIPALSFLSALLPSLCSSFILPALSLSPLYSSLHLFTMMHSLSLSAVLCPSFLPSFPKMDCLSVFSLFSSHSCIPSTRTHACFQNPSVFLTFFICSSCLLFLLLPVRLLQEQYKSKTSGLFHLQLFMVLL